MDIQPLKPIVPPEEKLSKSERVGRGMLFILSGLFIGFGLGFFTQNPLPGLLIGTGVGFSVFAISLFSRK